MPFRTLDPVTALVLIDLQKGILGPSTVRPMPDVLANAADLAHAFREASLPVVLVTVGGLPPGRTEAQPPAFTPPPDWTELADELQAADTDQRVIKTRHSAFPDTGLAHQLRDAGVTQVVLGGVATSIGVEATARSAYDEGFHVIVVTDATTDIAQDAHDHSVRYVFPRIGETPTTADILVALSAGVA